MSASSRRLRVLITNNTLDARAGSELYVRDLALGLLRRGHAPVAYSSVLGEVADELRAASIPVLDDLRSLSVAPDVIHAHHHLDAMCAMLRFPAVPAVFVCHGWQPWQEQPPVFPAIRRYVGVDDVCAERILTTPGVDPARVRTVYNAVDLTRFGRRPDPLPDRPRSALIFSNYASEDNYVGTIREACRAASIERVDVIGRGTGTAVDSSGARAAAVRPGVREGALRARGDGRRGRGDRRRLFRSRRDGHAGERRGDAPVELRIEDDAALAADGGGRDPRDRALSRGVQRRGLRLHPVECRRGGHDHQFERLYEEALTEPVVWSADAGRDACDAASSYMVTLADMLKGESDERRRHADAEARSAAGLHAARHENEALRAELTSLAAAGEALSARNQALAAADAMRSTLQSDLTRRDHDLAARTRALANTEATLDRTQADLALSQHSLAAAHRELEALRGSRTWRLLGAYRGVRNWLREV